MLQPLPAGGLRPVGAVPHPHPRDQGEALTTPPHRSVQGPNTLESTVTYLSLILTLLLTLALYSLSCMYPPTHLILPPYLSHVIALLLSSLS